MNGDIVLGALILDWHFDGTDREGTGWTGRESAQAAPTLERVFGAGQQSAGRKERLAASAASVGKAPPLGQSRNGPGRVASISVPADWEWDKERLSYCRRGTYLCSRRRGSCQTNQVNWKGAQHVAWTRTV